MAIVVRNAHKSYGDSPILQNVNMTVRPGSIYGLLGASGCGKTTLLSCIVGLKSLDGGVVRVLGRRPGEKGCGIPGPKVGFMPQDIAMYPIFTIKETFEYYGKIYGMSPRKIKERTEFLDSFLELPKLSKNINSLSGGQLRRVSLGVAMIHQPPLLILDEPTVGIDPVLRQTIWEHMMDLVADGKTSLILSTHYIDESRFCDCVGVMRHGRIIDEQAPELLLKQFDTPSLEAAVLKLCHMDEDLLEINHNVIATNPTNNLWNENKMPDPSDQAIDLVELRKIRRISLNSTNYGTWGRQRFPDPGKFTQTNWDIISSLAKKNFLVMFKHPQFLILLLVLPIFQIMLHNVVVGQDPVGMKVAYVNEDWNDLIDNQETVDLLRFCRASKSTRNECFKNTLFSPCLFLNQFGENELNLIPQASTKEALRMVKRGDAIAYIEIPKNFTFHLRNRFLYQKFIDKETIEGSSIKIRMDLSESITAGWLSKDVVEKFKGFLKDTLLSCGQDPRVIEIPLKFNAVYGKPDDPYTQYIQPALMITFMLALSGIPGVLWVVEKRMGMADRGAAAGITFSHIVGASLISDTIIIIGQMTLMIIPLVIFQNMDVQGSWFLLLSLVFLSALAGLSWGYLCGSIVNNEMEIILLQLLFFTVTLISSGCIWPLESVPIFQRIFCFTLPASIPIMAVRAIVLKGSGLENSTVLAGFGVAILWIVIPFMLSAYLNRRRN